MKKVWQVIFVLCLLATTAKAEWSFDPSADKWVDSIYQKLTIAERVGQLIDLRVNPKPDNIDELIEIITKYHIGSITITGGNIDASIRLINTLQANQKVAVFVTVENQNSFGFPFQESAQLPAPATFVQANDFQLLSSTIDVVAGIYHNLGMYGTSYNPNVIQYSENGLDFLSEFEGKGAFLFENLSEEYNRNGLIFSTNFYFNFSNDFAFSPKLLDSYNIETWKEKTENFKSEWKNNNIPQSIINIKSLPEFPDNEAVYFNKKIINPLFWKHLQYGGILSSDFDAIKSRHYNNSKEETIRTLIKIGSDKVVVSSGAEMAHTTIIKGLNERFFKQNEIKEKVKRMLSLKYMTTHTHPNLINDSHLQLKLNDPELFKLSYQVYSKAAKVEENGKKLMPFRDLVSTNFASLVLGFSESKTFQETLEKYTPFVHYMLPDISFDPYDLDILSEQLVQFDNVIVGLHTSGLMELDQSVMNFLKYLNDHTDVVLVFLGKSTILRDLEGFENILFVHEDNLYTQQIAAQVIFGALGTQDQGLKRLSYSTPEMQGMDSRVLEKIDQIVDEAISISATPGCQVLVARNGSVVLEKGYGYYTYDSIMPVDTRTIYDLASITKVAATTQAIMKLKEQGKIHLDSAVGTYLPELAGSNKASLIIKDVLAHQSGLRAFYPFWRNTIEDKDQLIHFYNDKPNDLYNKTVAYGMFAAEDLKDSLWHWTIETKMRRKREENEPYDYKYSDLGFYLLQVLVERVSNTPLDTYIDSVFYKSMGMSTLTFNPLCKFPLKRITPTERDNEFRHVLVWGTVHDQIAAMKGGVSGHAGLFGNAHDIAKIVEMHLQDGSYGGKQYLSKETVKEFASQQNENSRRGLGWDKPEKGEDYNPASRYASFDSFGHSGFTGTVVWADPTFDLVFVFLSNRVYPNSSNGKLIDFNIRKRIHDVVYESIWNYEKIYN